MLLHYFGHSCFSLRYSGGPVLVTDPFDASVSYPPCTIRCDAALVSHDHFDHNCVSTLAGRPEVISTPGAHAVSSVRVTGLPCFHDEVRGAKRGKNLIFILEGEGLRIAHLGDLGHMPDEGLLSALEGTDVLLIPIGGNYTIDTEQATDLIALARPRIAIAMHYRTPAYDCAMQTADEFERLAGACRMPSTIELTRDALSALPKHILMDYQ